MKRLLTFAGIIGTTVTGAAFAQSIGGIANPAIDAAQTGIAEWIGVGVTTLFFGFLGWLSNKIGIKVIEKFNRDAIGTATANFANYVIDELQKRFLSAAATGKTPDLSDLVQAGVEYVAGGSKDAVRESKIETERLAKQVEGALLNKGKEILSGELSKIVIGAQQ